MIVEKNNINPEELLSKMKSLREEVYEKGKRLFNRWENKISNENFRDSALNLCCYLALRSKDITEIQKELSLLGLSSLGRLESRTLETIDAVICTLGNLVDQDVNVYCYPPKKDFIGGKENLERNSEALFGEFPENRKTMIMVTMAKNLTYNDIEDLIKRGMNVARINCAHDNPSDWQRMIDNIRKAERKLNKSCKIMTDIAGPKVRIRWILSSVNNNKININDKILLSNSDKVLYDPDVPTKIGCSLPDIVNKLKNGETILFDDGSIEGKIIQIVDDGVVINVEKVVKEDGVKLKVDKGINFPNSDINLDIITEKDKEDLDFIVNKVDIISISFVNSPEDMDEAITEIYKRLEDKNMQKSVIAKIETPQGLKNLPGILMTGAGKTSFGIMIARGDLAIELGYLRFAELQQEILWICESADIPVIWATQVLESMAKTGIPSRAEVTDAAEGGSRSECVMLNKGQYIPDVVTFLDELLAVMRSNVYKKSAKLRSLNLAKNVFEKYDEL